MFKERIELRKKREFSDVLNASFAFIKQEFKPLARLILLYAGIPILVQAILSAFYIDTTFTDIFKNIGNPGAAQEFTTSMPAKVFLLHLINLIVQVFLTGLAYCYVVVYSEKGFEEINIKEVWNKFTTLFAALIGFNILGGIVIVLAFFALIIPGVYVMVPLSLIIIIKVAENNGFGESFSRCFYLVKNHWWETFGLLIITTIIVLTLSSIFSIPAAIFGITQTIMLENPGLDSFPFIITSILSTVGTALITPIPAIVMAFQYYSLVERKENLSLYDKIEKINKPESDNE